MKLILGSDDFAAYEEWDCADIDEVIERTRKYDQVNAGTAVDAKIEIFVEEGLVYVRDENYDDTYDEEEMEGTNFAEIGYIIGEVFDD